MLSLFSPLINFWFSLKYTLLIITNVAGRYLSDHQTEGTSL